MSKYKVNITGINTNDIKVLTTEEMEQLFISMKNGNKNAREQLVNGNLKLILSIIKKYNNKNENLDDLFQIGCIGLLKAIDNFDLSFGVKFSTYSVPMILGEIRRYLRDNSSIRISRSIKDIAYKALKLKDELTVTNGKIPQNSEIAKILEVDEIEIANALDALIPPISLFEPIYNDGGDTIYLFDQIEDKTFNKDMDDKISAKEEFDKLTDREKYIVEQRFIIGKTQMEIAEEIGISQAQISRLEKNVISKIKKRM